MKPIFQVLTLILAFATIPTVANTPAPTFLESSHWSAKIRAEKEHKSYLIIYEAATCSPCEWMNVNVFSESSVSSFISQNMVAAAVDVYSEDGKKQQKLHQLTRMPTFIIFDEKGREKGRLEEPVNSQGMLDFLKKHGQPEPIEMPIITDIPTTYEQETISPLIPQESPVSPASPTVMSPPKAQKPQAQSTEIGTFSIQIGAFNTKNSAYEVMGRMNDIYTTPATIYPETTNGKNYYKVSIGVFHDRKEADNFKGKMRAEGFMDAFVKEW